MAGRYIHMTHYYESLITRYDLPMTHYESYSPLMVLIISTSNDNLTGASYLEE